MDKIGILIGNEILKLRRRKILLVMLILLLVVCFFYQLLMGTLLETLSGVIIEERSATLSEQAELVLKEIEKNGGAEAENMYDRQQWYFYSEALADQIEYDDWRFQSGLLDDWAYAAAEGTSEATELKSLLERNDYAGYYRYQMAQNDLIYGMAGTAELAEAANWGYQYCLDHQIQPLTDDWRYLKALDASRALYQLRSYDLRLERTGISTDPVLYEETNNAFILAKYQLEHNVEINPADSFGQNSIVETALGGASKTSRFWDAIASTSGITLVGLFMIVIAGGVVAGEFQKGTVKFLLLVPAKRWKILLAKYCTVLLTGLFFLLVAWVGNFLFCLLFQGGKEAILPALFVKNGEVVRRSPYLLLLGRGLLSTVRVVVTATLAFAVSSLLRNSAAAVGVSMLVLFGGSTITSFLMLLGQDWGRYLIFANMDLVAVQDGTTGFAHQSMPGAVIVILLHMVVFLWTAFDSFTRREI